MGRHFATLHGGNEHKSEQWQHVGPQASCRDLLQSLYTASFIRETSPNRSKQPRSLTPDYEGWGGEGGDEYLVNLLT